MLTNSAILLLDLATFQTTLAIIIIIFLKHLATNVAIFKLYVFGHF